MFLHLRNSCAANEVLTQVLLNTGIIIYLTFTDGELSNIVIVRSLAKMLYGQIAFDGELI